jgi:hypothetical protein
VQAVPSEQTGGDGSSTGGPGSVASGACATFAEMVEAHSFGTSRDLAQPANVSHPAAEPTAASKQGDDATGSENSVDPQADGTATGVLNSAGGTTQPGVGEAAQAAVETFKLPINFQVNSASPTIGVSAQVSGKGTQKITGDAAGSKSSGLANTADAGKSKTAGAASDVTSQGSSSQSSGSHSDGSSNNGAGNNGSGQHSQADGSQAAAALAKAVDNSVSQVSTAHPVAHDPAATPGTTSAADSSRQSLPSAGAAAGQDGEATVGVSGINAARLIQMMGATEMRVGMHSSEFGNISIRTSVSQQQMLTQISLDHGDLSQAISAHIASVQAKLGSDYGLQASIEVNHQGASTSADSGSSSQREQRAFTPSLTAGSIATVAEPDIGLSAGARLSAAQSYRLDIQA